MIKKTLVLILILQLIYGCDSKNTVDAIGFDRKIMLQNYVDNLIKPAFNDLKSQTDLLQMATNNFVATTSLVNLVALQVAWTTAYTAYQYTNSYNFGAAAEDGLNKTLVEEIATFPVAHTKIDTLILLNNANFNDFNRNFRGFLAIEYLLFDVSNDNNLIIDKFTKQTSFENRKIFLTNAVSNLKTRIDAVASSWNGNYATEFVSNAGSGVGSSTSLLYNDFMKSFEVLKNFKLGIPLGRRPLQIKSEPQKVEAYYSSKTLICLQSHINSIDNIWYGKSKDGIDGVGFKEYLETTEGGNDLIKSTELQMKVIKDALAAIPTTSSVASQIQNSPQLLDNLHVEVQKHLRFYKSEMSSKLGISITYSSGDGD